MKNLLISIIGCFVAAWVAAAVVEVPLAPASVMIVGGGVAPPPATGCTPPGCILRTVCASGCNHNDVSDAFDWFVANESFGTAILKIELQDSGTYTEESFNITGISGTASSTSYLWLTSDATSPDNYPVLQATTSDVITVSENYTRIERLDIYLNGTGNSNEAIEITSAGATGTLISRNLIRGQWDDSTGGFADQDGIYTGNWDITSLYIDHNVIWGFQRNGIHIQNYGSAETQTVYLDHNTVWDMNNNDTQGGGMTFNADGGCTNNIYAYNNLVLAYNPAQGAAYRQYDSGTHNFTGTNNIAHDATAESKFTSSYDNVIAVEASPGANENAWVVDKDHPFDSEIAGENSFTVTQFGVGRTGSEPDSRQDFSADIRGVTRKATPSIGAYEYE